MRARLLALLFSLFVQLPVAGQYAWEVAALDNRYGHAMTFDPLRGVVVLFGGAPSVEIPVAETWLWDGRRWAMASPATSPPARLDHGLVFDSARGVSVLFGGRDAMGYMADTWEWDGQDWTQRNPAASPPGRSNHGLAYDSVRGVTVLFGGLNSSGVLGDTWEWDGKQWTERTPAVSPAARGGLPMGFDAARGVTVVYGGGRGWSAPADSSTWEWDGRSWQERITAVHPGGSGSWSTLAVHGNSMAYDPIGRRMLLANGLRTFTWAWDGQDWKAIPSPIEPSGRTGFGVAFDGTRGQLVLFGGRTKAPDRTGPNSDTWVLSNDTWSVARPPASPPPVSKSAMVYDQARGRAVLFALPNEVSVQPGTIWEWDGGEWLERSVTPGPRWRREHAMAYDSLRGRTLLFGGVANDPIPNETWEWDGESWFLAAPVLAPSPRTGHAMAYDSKRGVTVLFGGRGDPALRDTWEWDGRDWTQRFPATSPSGRRGHGMVYDSRRGVTVLFGGSSGASETWEWDGATWRLRKPALSPPGRMHHAMAFDASRGVVVLNGGYVPPTTYFKDTWEWDGETWTEVASAALSFGRVDHALAFDAARGLTLLFGGERYARASGYLSDLLAYGPAHPAGFAQRGPGCPGTAGTPRLAPLPGLWAWEGSVLSLGLEDLAPDRPALILLGLSSTTWGPLALPLDLGPWGLPGCFVHQDLVAAVAVATRGGKGVWSSALPARAGLLGGRFLAQGLGFDPGANPGGAVLSGGVEIRVGSR